LLQIHHRVIAFMAAFTLAVKAAFFERSKDEKDKGWPLPDAGSG